MQRTKRIKELERKYGKSFEEILVDVYTVKREGTRGVQRLLGGNPSPNMVIGWLKEAGITAYSNKEANRARFRFSINLDSIDKSFRDIALMAYKCEGTRPKNRVVEFVNSDTRLISFMMKFFRMVGVPESRFHIRLKIHEGDDREKIETYWSSLTGIPITQFNKTQIVSDRSKKTKRRLPFGTCSIRISSAELSETIQEAIENMLEANS